MRVTGVPRQLLWGLCVALVFALVLVATVTLLLIDHVTQVPDGHPRQFVGRWEVTNYHGGGKLAVYLRADGSFEQQMIGFPADPNRSLTGVWTARSGKIILSPFLDYDMADSSFELEASSSFSARLSLFGGASLDTIDWSFTRVGQ